MKLTVLLAGAAFAAATLVATGAQAWPGYGLDTNGPGLTLTLSGGNTVTITTSGQGPYDGSDDTYVGVINNSGSSVSSLFLKSTSVPIFGFESDGISAFPYNAPGNALDTTGYGGPNAYFTNISADFMSGRVNFIHPIQNGGTDYFSLEEALDQASFSNGGGITLPGVPEPATWAMLLIGFGSIGFVMRRQRKFLGVAA